MKGFRSKIDLGFVSIAVRFVDKDFIRLEVEGVPGEPIPFGMWDPEDATIYVRNDLRPIQARQTVLHELGHAALDLYDEVA